MKKNDIIILTATGFYSWLFYEQLPGVNFLIFSLLLVGMQLWKDPELIRNKNWLLNLPAIILSGLCILFYGNALSVLANIISLVVASVIAYNYKTSLIFLFFHGLYSYLVLPFTLFRNLNERLFREKNSGIGMQKVLMISIIPLIIFLLFFILYKNSNPIFKIYADKITFDFISFSWLLFSLMGFIIVAGFYFHRPNSGLTVLDNMLPDLLYQRSFQDTEISRLQIEKKSAAAVLILLNLLLLFVNVLDINHIWIFNKLPEGVTYADFVHQGVYTVIISIILAILVLVIYFRGDLNFFKGNQSLKVMASLWILQNVILVVTTIGKNYYYIFEYGLTYKRIGVYVYLLICLCGLFLTFYKVVKNNSQWFLIRKNAIALYIVLVISCIFNWDLLIAKYNLTYSKSPDLPYLFAISHSAYLDLYNYIESHPSPENTELRISLGYAGDNFVKKYDEKGWQSFNMEDQRVFNAIGNKFKSLNQEEVK